MASASPISICKNSNVNDNVVFQGTVPYNVTGWLEKNKDPLNESVVEQFRKSGMKLLTVLFEDSVDLGSGTKAKRAKGSTFQTVSGLYRVSLFLIQIFISLFPQYFDVHLKSVT